MSIDPAADFESERAERIEDYRNKSAWKDLSRDWMHHAFSNRYMYNFEWLGRPIIQVPADICAMQELVWRVRPDLIIETGIAHGGSLVLSSSLLALLDYCDAADAGEVLDVSRPKRKVVGVDIDIRKHNRIAIEKHPMARNITMIEGPSTDASIVEQVQELAAGAESVLVCLDSNHTHAHVLEELDAYASLVTRGSYCVVFDTIVEHLPADYFPDRPWKPGDNPTTAIREWLKRNPGFEVDETIDHKLMLSVAPGGYLRRRE